MVLGKAQLLKLLKLNLETEGVENAHHCSAGSERGIQIHYLLECFKTKVLGRGRAVGRGNQEREREQDGK